MIKKSVSNVARKRRHVRVRKKIHGSADCPRLNVYRSLKNIYAQIIDDDKGVTLVQASSLDSSLKGKYGGNKDTAAAVGKLIAQKAAEAGVKKVVFDRGGYLFHGRVKSLADGAREGGLEF
jgi:large subunit ribosomal protein L18